MKRKGKSLKFKCQHGKQECEVVSLHNCWLFILASWYKLKFSFKEPAFKDSWCPSWTSGTLVLWSTSTTSKRSSTSWSVWSGWLDLTHMSGAWFHKRKLSHHLNHNLRRPNSYYFKICINSKPLFQRYKESCDELQCCLPLSLFFFNCVTLLYKHAKLNLVDVFLGY